MSDAPAVDVAALLVAYRETLLRMHDARLETGGHPRRWNQLVDRLQALHLTLRGEPAGRVGLSALLADPNATVRVWAATHALHWAAAQAQAVLEHEAAGEGVDAFGARMTLREFRADRLDTTWRPAAGRAVVAFARQGTGQRTVRL